MGFSCRIAPPAWLLWRIVAKSTYLERLEVDRQVGRNWCCSQVTSEPNLSKIRMHSCILPTMGCSIMNQLLLSHRLLYHERLVGLLVCLFSISMSRLATLENLQIKVTSWLSMLCEPCSEVFGPSSCPDSSLSPSIFLIVHLLSHSFVLSSQGPPK